MKKFRFNILYIDAIAIEYKYIYLLILNFKHNFIYLFIFINKVKKNHHQFIQVVK